MGKIVYLDDSDFSNLTSFPERQDVVTLKKVVTDGVEQGKFLVPCSYVHLATLLPTSKNYEKHSLLRARTIKSICGENVFIHPGLLHQEEARIALEQAGSQPPLQQLLRRDGKWFPGFDLKNEKPISSLRREIIGSRQRRRAYKRAVDAAIEKFTDNYFKLDAYIDRDLLRNRVEALTYGDMSQAEFNREAERQFYDPENVIHRLENAKTLNKMRQEIESFGAMFTNAYHELTNITVKLAERAANASAPVAGAREFAIQIIRDKLFLGLYEVRRSYFRKLIKDQELSDSAVDKALVKCPGLTYVFGYLDLRMLHIFDSILSGSMTKRSNNPDRFNSDGGDALHLSYLPYVDFFRCDKDTSNALRDLGAPEQKICKTTNELIERLKTDS